MKPRHLPLLLLISLPVSAMGDEPARTLTLGEMDSVAAGSADAVAIAIGNGRAVLTNANTAAIGARTEGAAPNLDSYAYASGGTASGYSDDTLSVGVAANTDADTLSTTTIRIDPWVLQIGSVGIAAGSSLTVGNSGTFFGP